MAQRVFLHVGLPKTGTTYLQTLLWHNREVLRRQGVLLPGDSARQHLWASGVVREDPKLDRRSPEAKHAWDRLLADINAWQGTAIVSHEFFASAGAEQAERAVAALTDADVHVVVTARETLGLVTARWQEYVKNGSTVPIDDYPADDAPSGNDDWDWGTLDLADVLRRWSTAVPREQVHVLTLPKPDEPRQALWLRFAELVGIDPEGCDTSVSASNQSLGVVEVELLRRVNGDLQGFSAPADRGNWIRGYLAQGKLVPRDGEKFWPSPDRVEELVARGARIADEVAAAGYDVIGDVDDLRPPVDVPPRRHPDSVTDTELVEVATGLIAAMMTDVRRLSREARTETTKQAGWRQAVPPSVARLARALRRRTRG